jgi:hypothetical protein
VSVVNSDILDCGDLLKGSNVVLLNNVFQWFLLPAEQEKIWRFLREKLRSVFLSICLLPVFCYSFVDPYSDPPNLIKNLI